MRDNEIWKLFFVIPIALILITIAPFFIAAWFATVILIFQGFKDLALNFKFTPVDEAPVSVLNLKAIVNLLKNEGWSLTLVRVLGISIFIHGFGAILILIGCLLAVEGLVSR